MKSRKDETRRRGRGQRSRKGISDAGSLPVFMQADAAADGFAPKIDPGDCVWLGRDLALEPLESLRTAGVENEGALRLLLGALVDAQPADANGQTRAQRIDALEAAVLGKGKTRGEDAHDDEDLLLEIGRRYARQWFARPTVEIDVDPIVGEVLNNAIRDAGHIEHATLESAIRRLSRKFRANKDRILVRATLSYSSVHDVFYAQLLASLDALEGLGVAVDRTRVLARIRQNRE